MRSGFQPVISSPRRRILPDEGLIAPAGRLTSVDLPAPLGPITAWMVAGSSCSETESTATRPPKARLRPVVSNRGSGLAIIARLNQATAQSNATPEPGYAAR